MNVNHYLTIFFVISLFIHFLVIALLNVRPLPKADKLPELSITLLPPVQEQVPAIEQADNSAEKQAEVTPKTPAQVDVVVTTPEVTPDRDKPGDELHTEITQQKPAEKSNKPPVELKIDWYKMASDHIRQDMLNEFNQDFFNKDKRNKNPSVMFGGLPDFMRTPDTSDDFPSLFNRQLGKKVVTVYGFTIGDCLIGFKVIDYEALEEQARKETINNSTGLINCNFF